MTGLLGLTLAVMLATFVGLMLLANAFLFLFVGCLREAMRGLHRLFSHGNAEPVVHSFGHSGGTSPKRGN